jgi:hypothetical protein
VSESYPQETDHKKQYKKQITRDARMPAAARKEDKAMPMKRALYPADWEAISRRIRFGRAGGRCEWCGAENYQPHPITGSRVVLTTAHLPAAMSTMDCRDEVLAALCQRCHLNLDRPRHLRVRRRKRDLQRGQLELLRMR